MQILQTLAQMLETPTAERITTASLAAKIGVSEAALYRHFASKAQMFEGLLEFIEASVFGMVNKINANDPDPRTRVAAITQVVLGFAEKNPGMSRVMVGDALVLEHERLQSRMSALFNKLEGQLRHSLREIAEQVGSATPTVDANLAANVLVSFMLGRIQRFSRSNFRVLPTDSLASALQLLVR